MTIIDCQTCPVRGRMCGDCFVPVVARQWLEDPVPGGRGRGGRPAPVARADPPTTTGLPPAAEGLEPDDAEWAAVDVFVRAGMVNALDAAGVTATRSRQLWSDAG
ncbi:hypothetical protein [Ornithinimicrobium sediminis]|jgi:hypothetical protein|uniref:hypothetical protein n=1 Tax=Ornithinimicrobium sediminis TaxID=2904603 RepID=UPI001E5EBB41|nr:hypothetical protein [Ornithinimicrobium sediminis]MCE0488027.1 hypothetical protein [Ornithinimicrobium sediminis]